MKCLIWNVKRLNDPLKQKVVARIKKLNINLVCLLETRVKQNKMTDIIQTRFPNWNVLHNYSEAYNGRIWILWTSAMTVNMLASSDQSITYCIEICLQNFFFSAIYGCNDGIDRRKLGMHL